MRLTHFQNSSCHRPLLLTGLIAVILVATSDCFVPSTRQRTALARVRLSESKQNHPTRCHAKEKNCGGETLKQERQQFPKPPRKHDLAAITTKSIQSTLLALTVALSSWSMSAFPQSMSPLPASATDPGAIVSCLFKKCPVQLGECILNPKCLLNVACINTCNGREDETGCQIQCGNLFENDVVGDFNKCAVSDMECVPRKEDDGSYPVPSADKVVPKFDTAFFTGRWYITAGQNPLFDTFPCQVHFFSSTGPDRFVGKLNWRIEEPDGEFFTRDALQAFVQDKDMPAHLLNHDNEYLHYQDDWWIIDYEPDDNPGKVPPFAFVYYRGSNDAWDGYGGVVVYTRDAALPKSLLPRLREAAKKVNFDFDKDFTITDNSCPTELSEGEKALLREKFAGKVILQTEQQLQAQAVRVRGNAANSVKAQKIFFENGLEATQRAFNQLEEVTKAFEDEVVKGASQLEESVVKDGFGIGK